MFASELVNIESEGQFAVLRGLEDFREHLGGGLTVTQLRGIGRGFEVHELDPEVIIAAIHELEERHAKRKPFHPRIEKGASARLRS